MQVELVALEDRVFGDFQNYKQISRRPAVSAGLAFLGQAQLRAVVDPGRNVDLEFALRGA